MDQTEWEKAAEARKEIFRPKWFGQLLRGELSLGDTFWIGNFGVALVFVPISFAVMLLMTTLGINEQIQSIALGVIAAFFALYWAALTRAVFKTALRTPQVGGWRWLGVGYTILQLAAVTIFALILTGSSI
ncbi:MAG: hypothetical protein GVY36_18970 [Verrucomicrobia bacterium]|jgi:hypothetical protein|nr:hypothetical protein [Verrucomicrobiota bacterium]